RLHHDLVHRPVPGQGFLHRADRRPRHVVRVGEAGAVLRRQDPDHGEDRAVDGDLLVERIHVAEEVLGDGLPDHQHLAAVGHVLVPSRAISACTTFADPLPTATSRMTAATPISMPSTVSAERSLFAVTPRSANRTVSKRFTGGPPTSPARRRLTPRAARTGPRR